MSKFLNSIFFGLFFITSMILEIYCIHVLNGDLFTTIGIGIVVLISGYLLMDSIRSQWKESMNLMQKELETKYQEVNEKLVMSLSQMLDLQKGTYVATKKNTNVLQEEIIVILDHLNSMVKEQHKVIDDIMQLQKKSMEGQKNAINLELNYNKENTKQLIDIFKEESARLEQKQEKLFELIYQLEDKIASDSKESKSEAGNATKKKVVIPLYDDPNKNLTPEEISSLFASYGS